MVIEYSLIILFNIQYSTVSLYKVVLLVDVTVTTAVALAARTSTSLDFRVPMEEDNLLVLY